MKILSSLFDLGLSCVFFIDSQPTHNAYHIVNLSEKGILNLTELFHTDKAMVNCAAS